LVVQYHRQLFVYGLAIPRFPYALGMMLGSGFKRLFQGFRLLCRFIVQIAKSQFAKVFNPSSIRTAVYASIPSPHFQERQIPLALRIIVIDGKHLFYAWLQN
jgi:hypothetical protein